MKEIRVSPVISEMQFGQSSGGAVARYHYLGWAKTFALMGKAFAEAVLTISRNQTR